MGSVFKKFTAQDKAMIPFNAHKQYDFSSASAADNSLTWWNSSYTSESVSMYGTSFADGYGSDTINFVKYSQIDHLFYRQYKKMLIDRKGPHNYLKQPRSLYQKANILSIPSGLYGYEIRPGSFYLSSSVGKDIIDDQKGNLIISGTNLNNYPNDVRQNIFKLEPIDGYKRYDLGIFRDELPYANYRYINKDPNFHIEIEGGFYRRGKENPNGPLTYTSILGSPKELYPKDEDDSYYFNKLYYSNVQFSSSISESSQIFLNSSTGSYISSSHHERYNFDQDEDFSISFYVNPQPTGSTTPHLNVHGLGTDKKHIICKKGTKTIQTSLSSSDTNAEPQFPFEIYMVSNSLHFERSDGKVIFAASQSLKSGSATGSHHILCQVTGSTMEIYHNGFLAKSETFTYTQRRFGNKSNLYIGALGKNSTTDTQTSDGNPKYFNGNISNINIWTRAYDQTTVQNISSSLNGSPYVGNIFYQNGFAVITHPMHQDILEDPTDVNSLNTLQFQGTHLIYEHEYQCTVEEDEFNSSYNLSARKVKSPVKYQLADFTTGSYFNTYITTIGLYNEAGDLLVVGKLGQPMKCSDETDTTFVLRWDT